jgi:hypothetical protein
MNQDTPHATWTPKEDSQLYNLVLTIDFKWKSITPMMTGWAANQIKNCCYSVLLIQKTEFKMLQTVEQPAGNEQPRKFECKLLFLSQK